MKHLLHSEIGRKGVSYSTVKEELQKVQCTIVERIIPNFFFFFQPHLVTPLVTKRALLFFEILQMICFR